MKKLVTLAMAIALVLALATASAATLTLQLSDSQTDGSTVVMADREFARLVEEATNGEIVIEVFSNGALYTGEAEAVSALQTGALGLARVSASAMASYVPEVNAIQLPYMYKNSDHMWAALKSEIGTDMFAKFEEYGLVGMCWYDAGSRSYYITKAAYEKADFANADLKGIKIRMQDNPMMKDLTNALGGVAISGIGAGEIYSAITSGTIDGAENNAPTYVDHGDYEAADVYVLDCHTRNPEVLLMSKVYAEMLKSMGYYDVIMECAAKTEEYQRGLWDEFNAAAMEKIAARGNMIVEIDADTQAKYQEKVASVNASYGAGYEDIIAKIAEIGEAY